jgi:hypothetical protein
VVPHNTGTLPKPVLDAGGRFRGALNYRRERSNKCSLIEFALRYQSSDFGGSIAAPGKFPKVENFCLTMIMPKNLLSEII